MRLAVIVFGAAMLVAAVRPALAQDYSRPKSLTLWVDTKTGQLFTRPGKGRRPFIIPAAGVETGAIEHQVERKVEQKTETLEQTQQEMKADLAKTTQQTQEVSTEMAEVKPAWEDYIDNFKNKFRLGTVVYGDYRFYAHTGFGPQEIENVNSPGPGNNAFNSFDITRAYLNFYFNPTEDWTVRVTPDIYQTQGDGSQNSYSKTSGVKTNLNGNLALRLKYAYVQYGKAFDLIEPLKGDTITAGAIPNAFIPWEEDLVGFRYVAFDAPWNYYSLSSTQEGLSMQGPIKFNGLQYVDYDLGVYDNANFHQQEMTNTKQGMARVSIYPMGAQWRFDGLGLTGFYDYGYPNTAAPDLSTPSVKSAHSTRIAGLIHYTAEQWGLVAEWDLGHNAFGSKNLFSGSAPLDFTGGGTTVFGPFTKMAEALLDNGRAFEQGWDVMGHAHIPNTPFTLIGLFQWFEPNTKVDLNPLDFQRFLAGVEYQYNEFLRFALTSQNLTYYHDQENVPKGYFSSSTPAVTDAVPRDTHSVWLSAEFTY